MHFFVIYIYICGVKCRVVFKVGRPEFPFDAQSDLWVGPTNINLLIANRISPIYTQIFTYFLIFMIIRFVGRQHKYLNCQYKFPLIHTNIFPLIFSYVIFHYQLYHFLQIFTNVKMQKSVPLTLRGIAG